MLMNNWPFEGKNAHDQVYLFNKIILNVFHNFIPSIIITCNDKDPLWFNDGIPQILNIKDELLKQLTQDFLKYVWPFYNIIHERVKSKCLWTKLPSDEKLKITSSSQTHKTIYHNSGYLLLFGRRKLLSFDILSA